MLVAVRRIVADSNKTTKPTTPLIGFIALSVNNLTDQPVIMIVESHLARLILGKSPSLPPVPLVGLLLYINPRRISEALKSPTELLEVI